MNGEANVWIRLLDYLRDNWPRLLELTGQHLVMVLCGLGLALLAGIPLGIVCAKYRKAAPVILAIAGAVQVLPSLAMLALLFLILGLGFKTIVVGLFLYSLLPIIRNTYVGLTQVSPGVLEAGRGMGMSQLQLLAKVQLQLSLPFIVAGFRVAAVIAIGVAALAPLIGGDGLGREIYAGLNQRNDLKILAGAIPAALLALLADLVLGRLQARMFK